MGPGALRPRPEEVALSADWWEGGTYTNRGVASRAMGVVFARYGCDLVEPGAWSLLVMGVVLAGEGRGLAGEPPSWASFADRAQWSWIVQERASRGRFGSAGVWN